MKLEVPEPKVQQVCQEVCSEALVGPGDVLAYLDTLDDFRDSDREVSSSSTSTPGTVVVAPEITSISSKTALLPGASSGSVHVC